MEPLKQLELTHLIGIIMARQPRQQRIDVYGGFTSTGVDRTAGDKMRALAGLGQTMQEATLAIGKPIIQAKRAEQGIEAAEQARTVDPVTGEVSYGEVKKMSASKWGAAQYNANLVSGMDAQFRMDVRQNLTRIAVESEGNLEKFDSLVTGYQSGISGKANILPELRQSADTLVGAYREKIIAEQTTEALADAKANRALELKTASDDSFKFIADGQSQAAQLSIFEVVDGINADPDLTDPQKAYAVNQYQEQVLVAFSRKDLNDTVENEGYIAGLEYIEKIEDNLPSDMSMESREAYIKTLTADIANSQKVEDEIQTEKAANLKLDQANYALALTIEVLDGTAGIEEIKQAGTDNKISVGQFNTLENQFATTGKGSDNADVVDTINRLIQTDPEAAAVMIQGAAGTPRLSTRTASTMLKSIQSSENKGGILQTEEAKRFSDHLKKNIINTGFGAPNDPKHLKLESELQIVFAERVSNMEEGETIASITNELLQANKSILASRPPEAGTAKDYASAVGADSNLFKTLMADTSGKDGEPGPAAQATFQEAAVRLDDYFNLINAYNSFREDYDSIMKGL